MTKLFQILILCFLGNYACLAQDSLSFNDALAFTLLNNYDIKIAEVNEDVATNNATRGANNYLPTISSYR